MPLVVLPSAPVPAALVPIKLPCTKLPVAPLCRSTPARALPEITLPAPVADALSQAELVSEIQILGNDTIPVTKVSAQLSTRVGRAFDRAIVERDVRRLANLGWFIDVKPLYEATPQGRVVIFQVVERPTIRYVNYLGNEKVSDKKLAKETGLKAGGSVDPYAVEESRRKIKEYYPNEVVLSEDAHGHLIGTWVGTDVALPQSASGQSRWKGDGCSSASSGGVRIHNVVGPGSVVSPGG